MAAKVSIFARVAATVLCALWFGGLGALLLFVTALFRWNRPIAVQAAPRLFLVFGQYQLILAALLLATVFIWRVARPAWQITAIFALAAVASIGAAVLAGVIVPRMEMLRTVGASTNPAFARLHAMSGVCYLAELLALAAVQIITVLQPISPQPTPTR